MSYKVSLKKNNVEFNVLPEQSILDAALQANITLEHSCSNGLCGQCKAILNEGETGSWGTSADIKLRDGEILTCMTFPKSDLMIDATYYPELEMIERKTFPTKIQNIEFINQDILVLTLRVPPTAKLKYLAGQFVDLMWNNQKRSYSLASSSVKNNQFELHIKKVDGGVFSEFLFNELKEEKLLRFYGPLGTFFIRESNKPIIFLCTGSGFAPVKAMVEKLLENNSNREIHIYWGAQFRNDIYSSLPRKWAEKYSNVSFSSCLSKESVLIEREVKGYCQSEVIKQHSCLSEFVVYACGSDQMIHSSKELFIENGLPEKEFYSDSFLPSN